MHVSRIVYWYVRREPDSDRRAAILRTAVESTEGLSLPVQFVGLEEQSADPTRQGRERLLDDAALADLKSLCVRKVAAAAANGSLANVAQLLMILYRWSEWGGEEGPSAFCAKLASTPEGALRLVKTFLLRSTSHGMGDYVGRVHLFITLGELEKFADWEQIEHQLAGLSSDSLDERDRRAVTVFETAVARRRRGKPDLDGFHSVDRDDD